MCRARRARDDDNGVCDTLYVVHLLSSVEVEQVIVNHLQLFGMLGEIRLFKALAAVLVEELDEFIFGLIIHWRLRLEAPA